MTVHLNIITVLNMYIWNQKLILKACYCFKYFNYVCKIKLLHPIVYVLIVKN